MILWVLFLSLKGFCLGSPLENCVFLYILRLLFCNHMEMSVHLCIGNNGEYEKTKLLVLGNFILKL